MLLSQVHPGHGPHHVPNTRSSQQFVRQEVEDRRTRQQVSSITEDDTTDEEDLEDDKGVHWDEREIWEVTHVSEQELETRKEECYWPVYSQVQVRNV